MGVDWSLAGKNQYDYLDSLQQIGNVQTQKFNLQKGQYDFNQQRQQDAARPALFAQAQGGDYKGASAGALAGNDLDAYKVIAGLNEAQRNQVKLHSQLIGGFAASLSQLPQGDARMAAFRAAAPQLKAQGFTDEEIASADLSDNGLRGYIAAAGATDNALEAYYKSQAPLTVADGTQVYGATPMGGGARPLLAENAKDPPRADYQFDSVSGQWLLKPGTGGSANGGLPTGQPGGGGQPSGGGDPYNVVLGNGKFGNPPAPLTTMTLGQVYDFGRSTLIPNSKAAGVGRDSRGLLGSSAVGAYGITGETMRRVAPRVLGDGWKNLQFTPEVQDRLGEAVYNDAVRTGTPLNTVWSSLSPQEAAGLKGKSWAEARALIMQGESGGSSAPQSTQPQSGGLPTNVQARPPVDKRYHIASPEEVRTLNLDPSSRWQIGPDGQVAALPSKGDKPLTESQGKATGYLERAVAAAETLNSIPTAPKPSEANAALYSMDTRNPFRRNISPEAQRALSAQEAFVLAVLRQDSGAAINKDEVSSAMRIYFPQPGDSAETQADKRRQREAAIRGLRTAAGPGADTVRGKVPPGGGARVVPKVLKIERVK